MTATTVRIWYRTHKWTSLICTLFLLMSCLTGLPLIFHDEINGLLIKRVSPAKVPEGTPPASMDAMLAVGKQRYPKELPMWFGWDEDAPRVVLTLSPVSNAPRNTYHDLAFDVHTGALLEEFKHEDDIMSAVLDLHESLFVGPWGELFMGFIALCFVVSLVSGALVYGPFMRKLDFGMVRKNMPRRVRWLDLHNLLGIVTLVWALTVGATGLMNALAGPLFGIWQSQELPRLLTPYQGQPLPEHLGSVDQAVQIARHALPESTLTGFMFPDPEFGNSRHFLIWTKGNKPITSRLFTPVLVDAQNGSLAQAQPLPWYLRALEVSRPFHFGDYGGLPLKILWALMDLATISVLVTGLYLWLANRKRSLEGDLDQLVAAEMAEVR